MTNCYSQIHYSLSLLLFEKYIYEGFHDDRETDNLLYEKLTRQLHSLLGRELENKLKEELYTKYEDEL